MKRMNYSRTIMLCITVLFAILVFGSCINSGKKTFFKNLSATEAKAVIEKKHPFILDVRTQGEYDSGYIQGAQLIPVQQLLERIAEIEQYKEKDILVYCRSGNRSIVAVEILETNGFKRIYHLSSGIKDWINEGFDLMK